MSSAPRAARDPGRRVELAKIHVAKAQLATIGLDEKAYREVVYRMSSQFRRSSGVRSSALMTAQERHALLDELKRLGFQDAPAKNAGRPEDWIETDVPHLRKLLACWRDLERLGVIQPTKRKSKLRRFVRRMTGVEVLQWLTPEQTNQVIEGLKAWAARKSQRQQARRGDARRTVNGS